MTEKRLTKAQALALRREELGRCKALTGSGGECKNWGIGRANGLAYCGQHLGSIALAEFRETKRAEKRAAIDAQIDSYLAWAALHPSVHDRMPRDV